MTERAAKPLSAIRAGADGMASGSSWARTQRSSSAAKPASSIAVSRWSVPRARAVCRAAARSSTTGPAPGKPIVKVRGGAGDCRAIAATIAAESTPPDRNAPKGTSDIIWRCTASTKRSRSSAASALASSGPGAARKLSVRTRPSSATSTEAGASFAIPANSVRGAGTQRSAR